MGQYAPFPGSAGGAFVAASNDPIFSTVTWDAAPGFPVEGQVGEGLVRVSGSAFPSPIVPTGTVTVTASDGTNTYTVGTAPLTALNSHEATATLDFALPAGNWTLTATYSGDGNYLSAGADTSVLVSATPVPALACGPCQTCGRSRGARGPGPGRGAG